MPTPLMVRILSKEPSDSAVSVNGLAPALNTMPLTSMSDPTPSTSTAVTLETSKVAVSAGPLGTVAGIQLSGTSGNQQSKQSGSPPIHVALPANVVLAAESKSNCMAAART